MGKNQLIFTLKKQYVIINLIVYVNHVLIDVNKLYSRKN